MSLVHLDCVQYLLCRPSVLRLNTGEDGPNETSGCI